MPRPKPAARRSTTSTRGIWVRAALILLAVAVVYSNSLSGPFFADDNASISNNPNIRALWNPDQLFARQYNMPLAGRPLVTLAFAIDFARGGLAVEPYHLTNIAIHALCALLLFGIVRRTLQLPRLDQHFSAQSSNLAVGATLLWAVHPLTTEAVDYLTQRTELMVTLFLLTTLYAGIRSVTCRRKVLWQIVAVLSCSAGMLCKETMAVAPFLIVLYDRTFFFTSFADALRNRWRLYGGLALGWLVLLEMILPGPRANSVQISTLDASRTYLLNQAEMVARYFRLVIWPRGLVVDYGPMRPLGIRDVWLQAAVIIVMLVAAGVALLRKSAAAFPAAWIFLLLAPTSSVIPITTEVGAERRMYAPLMAISVLIVVIAYKIGAMRRLPTSAGLWSIAIIATVLGGVTMARNHEYSSELLLAQSELRNWPSDIAHAMVGSALTAEKRDEEAIQELQLGARTYPRARYNLGITLFNTKRLDEAIHELSEYATQDPSAELVPSARSAMGDAFSMQRKWQQAINEYRIALSMRPDDPDLKRRFATALNHQALTLADAGRFKDAVAMLRQSAELDPKDWSARHNLAAALLDAHDAAGAEEAARAAVAMNPTDAGSYDLLGRALAIQGKLDEAVAQFDIAVRLSPQEPQFREDLNRVKRLK